MSDIIDGATIALACTLLVSLTLTMFVGVIYRYVLNNALPWTEELAGISMGWLVFIGSAVLYRRHGHPEISLVLRRLSKGALAIASDLRLIAIGVYLVALIESGIALVSTTQPHTPALSISFTLLYTAIPVSAVCIFVHWIRDVLDAESDTRAGIIIAVVVAFGFVLHSSGSAAPQNIPLWLAWLAMPLLFALGVPIALVLGLTSFSAIIFSGTPISIAAQRLYAGIDNPAFLAIPAFMLTGALMQVTGMSDGLVAFASALVGRFRGGLAYADVLASVLFADTSGSAVADTAAIGGVMMPGMLSRGYGQGFVVAHQAAAGSLGTLFPPSISMIIFATVTSVSVTGLFLSSLIPGCLVAVTYMLIAWYIARKNNYPREARVGLSKFGAITLQALPSLIAPVIVLGGILLGVFTPYEAGAVAAVYVAVVGILKARRIPFAAFGKALVEGVKTAAMVLFIIANASIIAWVMIGDQIPQVVAARVAASSSNPIVVLILICLLLIALAIFLEPPAILIAVVPICLPIVQNVGVSPLHFGVVVMLTTAIGMLLPPIGITLLVSASIAGVPIDRAARYVVPYVLAVGADLLLVILVPSIATWLPSVARH